MSPSSIDSSVWQYSLSLSLCLNHVYFCLGQTLRREMIHNSTGRASLAKSRTILLAHLMLSTATFASLCFFTTHVVHRTFIFMPIVLRLFTPFNTFSPFIHLHARFGVKSFTTLHLISQRIYIFALFQGFTSLFRQFGCSTGSKALLQIKTWILEEVFMELLVLNSADYSVSYQ